MTYRVKDIGLAAALITAGQKLIEVLRESKICWFLFENGDKCAELDRKYWFGELLVNARSYKQSLDQLKNIVHFEERKGVIVNDKQ